MKKNQVIESFDIVKAIENNTLAEKLLFSKLENNEANWGEQFEKFYNYASTQLSVIKEPDASYETTYFILKRIICTVNALDNYFQIYSSMYGKINDELLKICFSYQDKLREFAHSIWLDKTLGEKFKLLLHHSTNKQQQDVLINWIKHGFESDVAPENKKIRFKFSQQLDKLAREFEANNNQATWKKNYALFVPLNKKSVLEGITEHVLEAGWYNALSINKKGWLFYVEDVTAALLLSCAKNREFRKKVYESYQKLNSDQRMLMNNDALLRNILSTKQKIAKNHGKKNYSELVLSNYVLNTTDKAYDYLNNMEHELKPLVEKVRENMLDYAKRDEISELKPWDLPYYYKEVQKIYQFRKRDLFLDYFNFEDVMKKLVKFFSRQLDVTFTQMDHPLSTSENGVVCYKMKDRRTKKMGYLLISPYYNEAKSCPTQFEILPCENWGNGVLSQSIEYVSMNFEKKGKRTPLTMENLKHLLHELGHAFHAFFSGVEDSFTTSLKNSWDLIELPSQFLEHLIYDKHFMNYLSSHYRTGKAISETLLQEMIEKENFFMGYDIYQDVQKYKAHLWLHENFKPFSKKNPHEIVENRLAMEGIIYNIARDQFMTSSGYMTDYAPAGYVYLYSAQLAFQIFEFYVDNEAYFQPYALRNIFNDIFNCEKPGHLKLHLEKFVDLFNVNMMKFLKKTWNIDLYGTTLWRNKQSNLSRAILKEVA